MNKRQAWACDLVLGAARLVCSTYVGSHLHNDIIRRKAANKALECVQEINKIRSDLYAAMWSMDVSEERRVLLDCLSEAAYMPLRHDDLIACHAAAFELIHPQLTRVMDEA